jgi:hypothetical protein
LSIPLRDIPNLILEKSWNPGVPFRNTSDATATGHFRGDDRLSQHQTDVIPGSTREGSRERVLADLFVALADTLVADFDVVELLDRLIQTCVELFDVTAAGVLIRDGRGRLQLVASSNAGAQELELFQLQADQGPCLDAVRLHSSVSVPDLTLDVDRWPRFKAAAEIIGFRAVHAVPLRLRSESVGGFGLFHSTPTVLSVADLHTVQALADVATIGILQQQHAAQSALLTDQLQFALDSRIIVEQAKGILSASGNISVDAAFDVLRRYSRDGNLKLSLVAQELVTGKLTSVELMKTARERRRSPSR